MFFNRKLNFKLMPFLLFSATCLATGQQFDPDVYCQKPELSISVDECEAVVDFFNQANFKDAKVLSAYTGRERYVSPFWEDEPDVARWPGVWFRDGFVRGLDFQYFKFTGKISEKVGLLTKLEHFYIGGKGITGELHADIFKDLVNLEGVAIQNTSLSGRLPDVHKGPEPKYGNSRSYIFSRNNFSGEIPSNYFINSSSVHFNDNKFSGELPAGFSKFTGNTILLQNNRLNGSVPDFENSLDIWRINFSNNRFVGPVDFLAEINDAVEVDISNNEFSGVLPSVHFSRDPSTYDVSNNQLSGELPSYTFSNTLWKAFAFNFSANDFVGGIPDEYVDVFSRELDVSGNRLSVGLSRFKARYEGAEIGNKLILGVQSAFTAEASGSTQGRVYRVTTGLDLPTVYTALIPEGYTITDASGCPNSVKGNIIIIPKDTMACDLVVNYRRCSSVEDCTIDIGSSAGVSNAYIEAPIAGETVSGVVQFRGWLSEPEIRSYTYYDADRPRTASLYVDGSELPLEVSFERSDVAKALGYREDSKPALGWSSLFNVGNLENGTHELVLKNTEGAIVAHGKFNSFSMQGENGEVKFFSDVERRLTIEDFPYQGALIELAFNSSEQNFVIVDQFDKQGRSFRSPVVHFTDDGRRPIESQLYNGVPQVAIETPRYNKDMLGVMSIRGWAYGSSVHQGAIYLAIDNGEPFRVSRGHREDVETSMGISSSYKLGWSQLYYAGNLKNGIHRLRVYGENTNKEKVLLAHTSFESFVPLNEEQEQAYISGKDKSLTVSDFPYVGSNVSIKFDQAGQNFVIYDQSK